jgi:hypothetical protein
MRLLCLTVLLCSVGLASAQGPQRKPLPTEELETYEGAPSFIWRTGSSPRLVVQHGGFTSYQVNIGANGENITGDAANEPSITIDPTNPNKMSIAWRQFNSVNSSFRQGGWAYTRNGGISWRFPGVLDSSFRSDPVLASDVAGSFFYLSLVPNFFDDIWRSNTGAQSWFRLGPATGGDKQWLTIDTTFSSGRGFQYQSWSTAGNNYGGRQFTRSVDGGANWLDPIYIPNGPSWHTLDVDNNGNLFIGGVNLETGVVWCVRSTDAKNPSIIPSFDQSTPVDLGGTFAFSAPINPVGLSGQVFLAVDRSGASTNNNVYMLASVQPYANSSGTDVMFAKSTNGGQSFSPARRINDDVVDAATWHWFGTLAVAPNGRIDVVWLDTRNSGNNSDSQLFYSYSMDGGDTWAPNVAVSELFNPFLGYPMQQKMGDYMTIVSDNGGGNVAYCATFNSEQDIYYVRVAPPAPIPTAAVSRKLHNGVAFDIALPLTGVPAIECRTGGGSNDYQLVVSFPGNVSLGSAAVTAGVGSLSSASASGSQVTVNLTGVGNAQNLRVTLFGLSDGAKTGNLDLPLSILVGDSNADRFVNAGDATQTRSRSGEATNTTNFRSDLNVDGTINAGDATVVRSRSGTSLP